MVLNFERADIREVIHSLATALGISYTIDPRIEGQVTIRTAGKIAREDLWPLLNQILRNNGIAAVKVGDVYQILPVAEAKTRAIIPRSKATKSSLTEKDAFAIEVVPVQHVSADEMVNILQPFVTPGGDVLSYPRANLLVITDLQSNIDRLRELITTFDSDVFHNLKTRVFKVQHGDPDELANEILGLLAPYGVTPTGEGEGGVYIVPLTRLNSLVAVAFDRTMFDEIEHWLHLLDIPPEAGAGGGGGGRGPGGRGGPGPRGGARRRRGRPRRGRGGRRAGGAGGGGRRRGRARHHDPGPGRRASRRAWPAAGPAAHLQGGGADRRRPGHQLARRARHQARLPAHRRRAEEDRRRTAPGAARGDDRGDHAQQGPLVRGRMGARTGEAQPDARPGQQQHVALPYRAAGAAGRRAHQRYVSRSTRPARRRLRGHLRSRALQHLHQRAPATQQREDALGAAHHGGRQPRGAHPGRQL